MFCTHTVELYQRRDCLPHFTKLKFRDGQLVRVWCVHPEKKLSSRGVRFIIGRNIHHDNFSNISSFSNKRPAFLTSWCPSILQLRCYRHRPSSIYQQQSTTCEWLSWSILLERTGALLSHASSLDDSKITFSSTRTLSCFTHLGRRSDGSVPKSSPAVSTRHAISSASARRSALDNPLRSFLRASISSPVQEERKPQHMRKVKDVTRNWVEMPHYWALQKFIFVLRKKESKTKKRMKEEGEEKGDCGPPTRSLFFFWNFVGLEPGST